MVTWSVPSSTGGAPITSYTATAKSGGETCKWTSGPLTCTVTGLTNGTAYTFTVTATNANGTGAASGVQRRHPVHGARRPDRRAATAGNESATVSWTARSDEGSPSPATR